MFNCMLTGVGGQGTVLLSRLIGAAAISKGYAVRGTETIGMAQRGGSVVSHVRMGEDMHSPLIPLKGADLLIAFEPAEAVRSLPFLKDEGVVIVLDRPVPPASNALAGDYDGSQMLDYLRQKVEKLIVINDDELIEKCKNSKVINVALLGVAVKNELLPFNLQDAEQTLKERLPERFLKMNIAALNIGASLE